MGYDLHITRKTNWYDESPVIALHDWLEFVAGDPEIQHDGFAEAPAGDGSILRVEGTGICVWKGYSGGANRENTAWLRWSKGNIVAKNPDQEIRRKMWLIAQSFDAKVQGEDGEHYDHDGEMLIAPANIRTTSERSTSANPKRPWWKFW